MGLQDYKQREPGANKRTFSERKWNGRISMRQKDESILTSQRRCRTSFAIRKQRRPMKRHGAVDAATE